ncbi:hypothetical protein GCM10009738_04460 [Kitasatospora viridis]
MCRAPKALPPPAPQSQPHGSTPCRAVKPPETQGEVKEMENIIFEDVDFSAVEDEELTDVVGGSGGFVTPLGKP